MRILIVWLVVVCMLALVGAPAVAARPLWAVVTSNSNPGWVVSSFSDEDPSSVIFSPLDCNAGIQLASQSNFVIDLGSVQDISRIGAVGQSAFLISYYYSIDGIVFSPFNNIYATANTSVCPTQTLNDLGTVTARYVKLVFEASGSINGVMIDIVDATPTPTPAPEISEVIHLPSGNAVIVERRWTHGDITVAALIFVVILQNGLEMLRVWSWRR